MLCWLIRMDPGLAVPGIRVGHRCKGSSALCRAATPRAYTSMADLDPRHCKARVHPDPPAQQAVTADHGGGDSESGEAHIWNLGMTRYRIQKTRYRYMPVSAPRFYDIVSQILSFDIGYDIELQYRIFCLRYRI